MIFSGEKTFSLAFPFWQTCLRKWAARARRWGKPVETMLIHPWDATSIILPHPAPPYARCAALVRRAREIPHQRPYRRTRPPWMTVRRTRIICDGSTMPVVRNSNEVLVENRVCRRPRKTSVRRSPLVFISEVRGCWHVGKPVETHRVYPCGVILSSCPALHPSHAPCWTPRSTRGLRRAPGPPLRGCRALACWRHARVSPEVSPPAAGADPAYRALLLAS